jgi:hypothetical protein
MRAFPDLVGGDVREVWRLVRAVAGVVAKEGGVGCSAAEAADGRAAADKVVDGATRACVPELVGALRSQGVGADALDALAEVAVLGGGRPVGVVRAVL